MTEYLCECGYQAPGPIVYKFHKERICSGKAEIERLIEQQRRDDRRIKIQYQVSLDEPIIGRDGFREGLSSILQSCAQCQEPMLAIKGSRLSRCQNCGWRDDCC